MRRGILGKATASKTVLISDVNCDGRTDLLKSDADDWTDTANDNNVYTLLDTDNSTTFGVMDIPNKLHNVRISGILSSLSITKTSCVPHCWLIPAWPVSQYSYWYSVRTRLKILDKLSLLSITKTLCLPHCLLIQHIYFAESQHSHWLSAETHTSLAFLDLPGFFTYIKTILQMGPTQCQ